MKKLFGAAFFMIGFLATTYAMGQVYNDRHEIMTGPVDRMAGQHNAMYANIAMPGEEQAAVLQAERYTNMIEPLDQVIDQHFNILQETKTIVEETPAAE